MNRRSLLAAVLAAPFAKIAPATSIYPDWFGPGKLRMITGHPFSTVVSITPPPIHYFPLDTATGGAIGGLLEPKR